MQRRYFLSSALGGLSASALGQTSVAPFDWRGFAGQSIEVLLTKNPRGELLKKHQREFESLRQSCCRSRQGPNLATLLRSSQSSLGVALF